MRRLILWPVDVKAKVGTHQWNVRLLDLLTDAFCIVSHIVVTQPSSVSVADMHS